jgi:hypothetical protein
MAGRYVLPEFGITPFTCPHCETLAPQESASAWMYVHPESWSGSPDMFLSKCTSCLQSVVWVKSRDFAAELLRIKRREVQSAEEPPPNVLRMVYPSRSFAPKPNDDLPSDITADYKEAASVLPYSPRSSAALLRLCLQKLCQHFGEPGKDINKDIGALVAKGTIRQSIQMAMDTVRITGNESVHPGELNLNDDQDLAQSLFVLINLIADEAITQPKTIQTLFDKMPENKRNAVEERDSKP